MGLICERLGFLKEDGFAALINYSKTFLFPMGTLKTRFIG
jgi:hypothetical protein